MKVVEVLGAKIEIPDRCADCGEVPPVNGLGMDVGGFNEMADTCSFCGQGIRLVSAKFLHFHDVNRKRWGPDNNRWMLDHPQYEDAWFWYSGGPVRFDIFAHVSCAKAGMPHAVLRPQFGDRGPCPDFSGTDVIALDCESCGAKPDENDLRTVIARIYDLSRARSCVYCGQIIKLLRVVVHHFSMIGNHGVWQEKERRWEPRVDWQARANEGVLDFPGHLACARKAMPHATFEVVGPMVQQ